MIIVHHLICQILKYIFVNKSLLDKIRDKFEPDFEVMLSDNSEAENDFNKSQTKADDVEFVLQFDPPVYCQRYSVVQQILIDSKWAGTIKKIVDFGCAEFGMFNYVKRIIGLHEVLCVDVDLLTLEQHIGRLYPLNVDYLKRRTEPLNLKVLNGSIAYPSAELLDVDVVICIEIIEHLYPDTLEAVPYNVFGVIKPRIAIFTTPNADFNVLFPNFSGFRHWDHKFEWTRQQFEDWAKNIIARYPEYSVYFEGIGHGPVGTEKYGECSQMAVFLKNTDQEPNNFERDYKNFFTDKQEKETACKFCEFKKNYKDFNFISSGICTYYSNNLIDSKSCDCLHAKVSYNEVARIEYPYEVDNRTQDERVLHEVMYTIFRLGHINSRYYNEELDEAEIPLYELLYTSSGEMLSIDYLRKILEDADYLIKECLIYDEKQICVIYNLNDNNTMSKSSHKTKSTDPKENIVPNSNSNDNDSNWDNQSFDEAPSELTADSLPPIPIDNNEKKTSDDVGESSNSPNKKIECLYNSGCPTSSSSIEMVTPELLKSMQKGKLGTN